MVFCLDLIYGQTCNQNHPFTELPAKFCFDLLWFVTLFYPGSRIYYVLDHFAQLVNEERSGPQNHFEKNIEKKNHSEKALKY
jgi:hypothetical protein